MVRRYSVQIVLLTGLGASANRQLTLEQAYQLRAAGIHITAVGIGNWLNRYEINNIASQPYRTNAIFASSFNSLQSEATRPVRDIICSS